MVKKCKKIGIVLLLSALCMGTGTVMSGCGNATEAKIQEAGLSDSSAASESTQDLPSYAYNGSDTYMEAMLKYLQEKPSADGETIIPAPVIFYIDDTDKKDIRVWGNFWSFGYRLQGKTLFSSSGGERPGLFHLRKENGTVRVTSFHSAGDGDQYAKDIKKFCKSVKGLTTPDIQKLYEQSTDASNTMVKNAREVFLEQYISDNHLAVTGYKDYGWDRQSLGTLKMIRLDDKTYVETGEYSYAGHSGNMDFKVNVAVKDLLLTENNSSNFATCKGQYGKQKNQIEVSLKDGWHIFQDEESVAETGDTVDQE